MLPLAALLIVRSTIDGTTRAFGDAAMQPRDRGGARQPLERSRQRQLAPVSVAVTEPLPVTLARSAPVIGTQPSRAVNFSPLCARSPAPERQDHCRDWDDCNGSSACHVPLPVKD